VGNDLARMSESDRKILTNPDVIVIDQDQLGVQADLLYPIGGFSVWTIIKWRVAIDIFSSTWAIISILQS
jgi:hypothetical protein